MPDSVPCRWRKLLTTSLFEEVGRLAAAHQAIDLGAGAPDFNGSSVAKEAAAAAIAAAGHDQYSPSAGLPVLTAAIAEQQRRCYDLVYDASEVTVFAGASEALFCTLRAACAAGDEVILLEPFFDAYRPAILISDGIARAAPLRQPGFTLDPAGIERLITSRTRAIVFNDPHNPTGRVFSAAERAAVAALCRRHDLLAISDQVYEHLSFDADFQPLATLPGMRERTITIGSLSKAFALTGWKIGYACAPPAITAALRAVHAAVTLCASTPLQYAMAAALATGDAFLRDLRSRYRSRRDLLCTGLAELGFGVVPPAGGCFLLADVRPLGYRTGMELCRRLPALARVAVRPLGPFYLDATTDPGLVRFAFCKQEATLLEALARMRAADLRAVPSMVEAVP